MRLGILNKRTNVMREIWKRLPPLAKWALVAKRGLPGNVLLGDIRI